FSGAKPVRTDEPVGLVEPILTLQRRRRGRKSRRGLRNGTVGRVVDAAQAIGSIKRFRQVENRSIVGLVRTYDQLRALASRRERPLRILRRLLVRADAAHGEPDRASRLLRGERPQRRLARQLYIDAEPVGVEASLRDQRFVGVRDGFEV